MLDAIFSWDTLWWFLMILYIPACLGLIVIVLLQKGKGTGFAGAFGVGPGSEAVFGPRARRSLPVRLTYIAATTFMIIALVMSLISGRVGKGARPDLVDAQGAEAATFSGLSDLIDEDASTEATSTPESAITEDGAAEPGGETAQPAETPDESASAPPEGEAEGTEPQTP